jgi:hypothetical protein
MSYLELPPKLSSLAQLLMACPACRFILQIPPAAVATKAAARRRRERGRKASMFGDTFCRG